MREGDTGCFQSRKILLIFLHKQGVAIRTFLSYKTDQYQHHRKDPSEVTVPGWHTKKGQHIHPSQPAQLQGVCLQQGLPDRDVLAFNRQEVISFSTTTCNLCRRWHKALCMAARMMQVLRSSQPYRKRNLHSIGPATKKMHAHSVYASHWGGVGVQIC